MKIVKDKGAEHNQFMILWRSYFVPRRGRRVLNEVLAQKSMPENIKDELDNTKFAKF
jgi:hypothetical protein